MDKSPIIWQGNYYYTIKKNGKKGLVDEKGTEVYPVIFDDSMDQIVDFYTFLSSSSKIVPFAKADGKADNRKFAWGYMDKTTGNIVINPSYHRAYPFHNGIAKVVTTSTKNINTDWGAKVVVALEEDESMDVFIDEKGKIIGQAPNSKPFFDTTGFYKGHAFVRYFNETSWSIIDESGKITPTKIPTDRTKLFFIDEGGYYKVVDSSDSYVILGYYNERGDKIDEFAIQGNNKNINNKVEGLERWDDYGYFKKEKEAKTVFYDLGNDNKVTIPSQHKTSNIYQYDHDYLYASQGTSCSLIDLNGQEVYQTACKDQRLVGKINDVPVFTNNKAIFYKDINGDKVSNLCEQARSVGHGNFIIRKDGKSGVVKLTI
jgi:hypothetical protein